MYWESRVRAARPGQEIEVPLISGATLAANGYYKSVGLPTGQVADYRKALPDGKGVHVKIYRNRVTAHLDRVDPSRDLLGHLILDAPVFTGLAVAAVAALVGSVSSAKRPQRVRF